MMAQQKMHCALQKTCRNTQKVADGGNSSPWRKSVEQNNFRPSSRVTYDSEVSSFVWRNSDQRCAILTFFAPEPDGRWKIVALPMHCPDHSIHLGSGAQVKMDGLHLISPSPVGSVKVDRQKAHGGNTSDRSCSVKSFTARSLSGSNSQRQSRNKGLANKVSKRNQFQGNSSFQNSLRGVDSSVMIPSGSDVTNSRDIYVDVSKVDKAVKKNSRKKAKKKGKHNKKLSCDASSIELGCAHGSSISETGVNKNMDLGVGPLPYATTLAVPLPELSGNGKDIEGNRNGTIDCFESPKTCTSSIDEVDVSEALPPSVVQSSSNSENGTQTDYTEGSILNGGIQDLHSKSISCFNDPYSNVLSEPQDSFVFDSVSVGSNSDKSIYSSGDVKISNKESSGINPSESPSSTAKKGCFPRGNMLNGLAGSSYNAVGTNKGANGDTHTVVPTKRSKQIKRVPRSSRVHRVSSVENFRSRPGKENYHSVWQKVQRNDVGECNYELNKVNSVCSLPDIELKEVPLLKKNCNVGESNKLSNHEDKSQSKPKVSRKLKRKTSPGSKQEYNCFSSKGSHANKASSNVSTKTNMQQSELLDVPARVSGQKGLGSVSRSHSKISCTKIGFQINRVESISSEPVQSLKVSPNQLEPLEDVCNDVSCSNSKPVQNENSELSKSCDYLDQPELLEGQSAVYLRPLVGDEATKIDKDVSIAEHSKQDHGTGSILQKWIPVGMKDSLLMSSVLSNDNLDQSAAESRTSKDVAEEELAYDPHTLPSSMVVTVLCTVQGSGDCNVLPSENGGPTQKLRNHSACIPKQCCLVHEPKGQNNFAFENDSNKIAQAVNDAYKARLASEALQMTTGCPIAEFERLLHSASPVIRLQRNTISCQTCSNDGPFGGYLCRHEKPRISLGCLWQWYEKHGSYGLEVRAEDYEQSKRLGIDRFTFRAYFVPFLSAVQLFRYRQSSPLDNEKGIPGTETMGACEMDEISENPTNIGHLPIFSVLVPQPRTEETSFLPQRNHDCCVERSSVCIKDDVSIQSVDSAWSDDLELLFEYFEVEQPHQRRPLFEMIKELVRGDGPSQYRAYGDPTTLDSVNLHDLHPKSWYSVAWYPIYRIPDGNFRAAFLTYHSLGHLVHRSATSKSFSEDACIVSPVVGLQNYNAQGECWFQLRNSAPSPQIGGIKSSTSHRSASILSLSLSVSFFFFPCGGTCSICVGDLRITTFFFFPSCDETCMELVFSNWNQVQATKNSSNKQNCSTCFVPYLQVI
ncbi:uncharacterized protein LOC132293671 isoform X2 [Cornus florida]|uniref:uncharacterized protein LOC132293671 isoform X2 n=1 Tax=Cornus florida TaxID=4283 RepID=UPI002899F9C1|nr:uncharacterized protein LOC132293671 isoform X2 [Cornus florida]